VKEVNAASETSIFSSFSQDARMNASRRKEKLMIFISLVIWLQQRYGQFKQKSILIIEDLKNLDRFAQRITEKKMLSADHGV
jgi:hypothetical protein